MSISLARQTAYHILRRVDAGKAFAVDLLHGDEVARLSEADRHLATELVMGVLRWRGDLDFEIERLSGKPLTRFDPEIVAILRMGLYQIRCLSRIPKRAAVNESVELAKAARKRSAAGLVNAVLRKGHPLDAFMGSGGTDLVSTGRGERRSPSAEPCSTPPGEASLQAACRAMPRWLLDRWTAHFGAEAAGQLAWASVQVPPTTLRIVAAATREDVQSALEAEGVKTAPAPYASRALVVESGDVVGSSAYLRGWVAIQDEASELVGELVRPAPSDRVLDLCAAPGSKTSQLAECLGSGGLLVACDSSARRLATMVRLAGRQFTAKSTPNLVRLDACQPLPFGATFNRVLVDAPCSGTGTLARNPEIKWRLQPDDLLRLAATQVAIVANALGALAPSGRLVYATCSLEPEENEGVVERVLGQTPGFRRLGWHELTDEFPPLTSLFDSQAYFRTRPGPHRMDGFFAAVIVRQV